MPRAVISGGTGFVGRFITEELLASGFDVSIIGRHRPAANMFSSDVQFYQAVLGQNVNYQPIFEGADCYIHAALDHQPGLYVGGEGNDPKGFALKNLAGTAALFKQAKKAGIQKAVFLSDQAVYGRGEPGAQFYETDVAAPTNLYALLKLETETILQAMKTSAFATTSLRLSSVYGPAMNSHQQKWDSLFQAYLSGKPIDPGASCEVHGEDVARAVLLIIEAESIRVSGGVFNAMDMIVDRQDILTPLQKATGCQNELPKRANADHIGTMNCDKLKRLEWRTGGIVKLGMTLDRIIKPYIQAA